MFRHWKIFVPIGAIIGIMIVMVLYFVGPKILTNKSGQASPKPHIAMTPEIGMEGNEAVVAVIFHNRWREDVDKPSFKVSIDIDGKDNPGERRDVSILRADLARKIFVELSQSIYHLLIAGKLPLKVMASVTYSFHGMPYTESCVTKYNASIRRFDYVDC
jgi:hypothetical protein